MSIKKINIDKNEFINNIYKQKCPQYRYMPAIISAVSKIIVLGDIHGDYKLFVNLLTIANVISIDPRTQNIVWTGENTYVVQVGDQIDRCRPINNMSCSNPATTYNDEASDIKIMNLANELDKQASRVGGAFISLLGNHEIMNASGAMTYVSYMGLREFDDYKDPQNLDIKFKNGRVAREHAFAPGNEIGTMLGCTRLPAIIIGTHLFVHAGIIDGLIEHLGITGTDDLETINIAVRMWLLKLIKKKHIKHIIQSSDISMFWTRILGNIPPNTSFDNPVCSNHIGKVLKLFKIGSIIIGHTPQSFTYSKDLNQTCDGKVWRVDNGSSAAFSRFDKDLLMTGKIKESRRPQVLEIVNDSEYYIIDGISRKKVN